MHSTTKPSEHRDRVRRRLLTGKGYFDAAGALEGQPADFGPSSVILKVLAFEVMLKAALFAETGRASQGHNYEELWQSLPDDVQKAVVDFGTLRFAGHVTYSDLTKKLVDWRRAFEGYRYDYEINEERSRDEIRAKSTNWEEPDFEFHPLEIEGLILGLENHLQNWLIN